MGEKDDTTPKPTYLGLPHIDDMPDDGELHSCYLDIVLRTIIDIKQPPSEAKDVD